ncbi:MAG: alpha/beta hydrolase [Oceanococcus sp.]
MKAKFIFSMSVLACAACSGQSSTSSASLTTDELAAEAIYLNDNPACPAPRCFDIDIPLPEGVSVSNNRVRIILPQGYAESDEEYPVLYLLHDAPGNYQTWTEVGQVFETLSDKNVIAIMPDGGGGNPGWYSDWLDESFQWETFHISVMKPYLEERLRVLGDGHRAIAGPSMGGHGAMSYASRYPGMFQAAAGFSGAVDFLHLEQISALYTFLGNPIAGTPNGPIWGEPVSNYEIWQEHDPGFNIDGLANTAVFLSCGNGLPGGPHDDEGTPATYAIEPILEQMNLSFAQALADAGIQHDTWFYGPGFHEWPHYRDGFAWALPQMLPLISAQ